MALTLEERERFRRWDREDPPDSWERQRNEKVKAIQGVGNSFVEAHADGTPAVASTCTPRDECCRVCANSQTCGDSCISRNVNCRREPGCACSLQEVCAE